jgi:hypothetical protein
MLNQVKNWTTVRFFLVVCLILAALSFHITALRSDSLNTNPSTVYLPTIIKTIIETPPADGSVPYPLVFVSRQIPPIGSAYWDEPNGIPGVGTFSRFEIAAPGKLLVREPNGSIRTLIDGSNPTPASLNLIDVNAPDVSYNGQQIVFAGIPAGNYPSSNPGGWRLYKINVDGTGLTQVTFSDRDIDLSQFGSAGNIFTNYDDTDPAWLPDGRIVFASTRYPSMAQYSGVRTTNLHTVNADGSGMNRITTERNGAERPVIDPLTGEIVFTRWWRNHRFAADSMQTITDPQGGYIQHLGLTTEPNHVGGPGNLNRNFWQLASIKPDGTDLTMWTGFLRLSTGTHAYGGAFTPGGDFITNFFPMANMTEAAGFGGLRRYQRGAYLYEPIVGVADFTLDYVSPSNPISYGIFNGSYAAEPDVLPDGRIVFSWAPDIYQDYGLHVINPDGTGQRLLYNEPGTTQLRARVIRQRPLPPILPDTVNQTANLLPPTAAGPYDTDGTFVFHALNVYFNAPVDFEIVNAPPVGSADTIRFYVDHQRHSPGSFPYLDWPVLLDVIPVNPNGSVINPNAPANVPLFEQLRAANGTVPVTMGPHGQQGQGSMKIDGAAHVTGMNFSPPNVVSRCVGCHTGHTMIPVPENPQDALWTNLATGAAVAVSSAHNPDRLNGLIDRRVMNGNIQQYWMSANGQRQNQWVELTFPVPVTVRTVRLYNPRHEGNTNLVVHNGTVRLYSDAAGNNEVASQSFGQLATAGTDVNFNEVLVRKVRVEIGQVSGQVTGMQSVSLAEIEVIARAEAGP